MASMSLKTPADAAIPAAVQLACNLVARPTSSRTIRDLGKEESVAPLERDCLGYRTIVRIALGYIKLRVGRNSTSNKVLLKNILLTVIACTFTTVTRTWLRVRICNSLHVAATIKRFWCDN